MYIGDGVKQCSFKDGRDDYATDTMYKSDGDDEEVITARRLDQKTEDDNYQGWPLKLWKPQDGAIVKDVYLDDEKATIVLYESVRMLHGRPNALHGPCYAAMFIHFRPTDWERNEFPRLITHWQRGDEPLHNGRANMNWRQIAGAFVENPAVKAIRWSVSPPGDSALAVAAEAFTINVKPEDQVAVGAPVWTSAV